MRGLITILAAILAGCATRPSLRVPTRSELSSLSRGARCLALSPGMTTADVRWLHGPPDTIMTPRWYQGVRRDSWQFDGAPGTYASNDMLLVSFKDGRVNGAWHPWGGGGSGPPSAERERLLARDWSQPDLRSWDERER